MTMDRSDVVSLLNDMIETSRDGEQGFRTCAENAKSPQLKSFFLDGAQRCQQAVSELQQYVTQYGGSAETSGRIAQGENTRNPGCSTTSTPMNPTPTATQRRQPIRSPSMGTDSRVISSGMVKRMA